MVALELAVFRSGLFRQVAYWITMAISLGFMIPVDGWLTKLSAPIVIYRAGDTSGIRPIWDILARGVRLRVRPADARDRSCGTRAGRDRVADAGGRPRDRALLVVGSFVAMEAVSATPRTAG